MKLPPPLLLLPMATTKCKCGYCWEYKGKLKSPTCPSCCRKVLSQAIPKQISKEVIEELPAPEKAIEIGKMIHASKIEQAYTEIREKYDHDTAEYIIRGIKQKKAEFARRNNNSF